MRKLSVAVDLDSTLNNLDEVWILKDYNEMYNDNLTAEDMVCWDTHKYVKPECGKKVFEILAQPGYFRNLGLKDAWTKESFEWLCEHFDVYIVSSCHPDSVADKVAWMADHFPNFDPKRFIACHHKGLINTDLLIDDGPHNVVEFKQESLLIDAAYNRHLNGLEHDFKRVKNWKEIREHLQMVLGMMEEEA
jgi:5'-nucleotidase